MHGVFLDLDSLAPADLDLARLQSSLDSWELKPHTGPDQLAAAIANADVVVSNKAVLDANTIAGAAALKLVCVAATGYNNIDIEAAANRNIAVSNVRSYATASVVQHVFSLLLTLVTSMDSYRREVHDGTWSASEFFCLLGHPVRELDGMTMGIVGYGELGQAVARMAACFGMRVLIAKRDHEDARQGRLDLHAMLAQVDVLSLHCPLTESNRGLLGEDEFALMKNDAILINTARGPLVDESALLAALASGRLGGAGLDVLETEPPVAGSPILNKAALAGWDNLVITPHTAWASRQSRQRLVDEIAENILAFRRGEPRNVVNAAGTV